LRWKKYDTESFRALRKVVKSVDPLYPSGDETPTIPKSGISENKPKTAVISILAKT
jgi:hypothetical protein